MDRGQNEQVTLSLETRPEQAGTAHPPASARHSTASTSSPSSGDSDAAVAKANGRSHVAATFAPSKLAEDPGCTRSAPAMLRPELMYRDRCARQIGAYADADAMLRYSLLQRPMEQQSRSALCHDGKQCGQLVVATRACASTLEDGSAAVQAAMTMSDTNTINQLDLPL